MSRLIAVPMCTADCVVFAGDDFLARNVCMPAVAGSLYCTTGSLQVFDRLVSRVAAAPSVWLQRGQTHFLGWLGFVFMQSMERVGRVLYFLSSILTNDGELNGNLVMYTAGFIIP